MSPRCEVEASQCFDRDEIDEDRANVTVDEIEIVLLDQGTQPLAQQWHVRARDRPSEHDRPTIGPDPCPLAFQIASLY